MKRIILSLGLAWLGITSIYFVNDAKAVSNVMAPWEMADQLEDEVQYLIANYPVSSQSTSSSFQTLSLTTYYLRDNSTGGDCSIIGTWNASNKNCLLTGDINGKIIIENSGVTLDGGGYSLIGTGPADSDIGIYSYGFNNIVIKNIIVDNFYMGINLQNSTGSRITDNQARNNTYGILAFSFNSGYIEDNIADSNQRGFWLGSNNGTSIADNVISNTTDTGLYSQSSSSTFARNIISNGNIGIKIGESAGTFVDNRFNNNKYNFFPLETSGGSVINTTNLVDGKPIYYLKNVTNTVFTASDNIGAFYCRNCSNINVSNQTFRDSGIALFLINTTNSSFSNISLDSNYLGLANGQSSNNTFTNNAFEGNYQNFSIGNSPTSFNNSINTSNTIDGKPIHYFYGASNQTILGVNLGMFLCYSCNNVNLLGSILDVANESGEPLFVIKNSDSMIIDGNSFGVGGTIDDSNNIIFKNNDLFGVSYMSLWESTNSKVYHNNFSNGFGCYYAAACATNSFNETLPDGGNHWTGANCVDSNSDNVCDSGYVGSNFTDHYPWKDQNAWLGVRPNLATLKQFKSDGLLEISQGGTTMETTGLRPQSSTIVFKAEVSDVNNNDVKIQVEVKPIGQSFNGTGLVQSDLVASGSTAIAAKPGILPGSYKWRARAVDENGNRSNWIEFGTNSADFVVKQVPLYTQAVSAYNYPANTNDQWATRDYADGSNGNYSCGSTIEKCGCAITSSVMVLRYHNITTAQGSSVTPLTINNWLQANNGYASGNINWDSVAKYSGFNVKFAKRDNTLNNYGLLEQYLDQDYPVIAFEKSGRGGINQDHFLVIDSELANTYNVKDPAWYNTKTLKDPIYSRQTANALKVRGYNNEFDGLRIFIPWNGTAYKSLTLNLASPAEFLITDAEGRRLGKDPISNNEYNEIPGATYIEEGIGDGTDSEEFAHRYKVVHIPDPIEGEYEIKVIGTGAGEYTVNSYTLDSDGDVTSSNLNGNIIENVSTVYALNYDPQDSSNTTIEPVDQTAPTTSISLSGTTGTNGWHKSNVEVTLSATDDTGGVGVWQTRYSIDNGATWNVYSAPFTISIEGTTAILYESEDYIGNIETQQSQIIKIDKTNPEAKIYFDTSINELKVTGTDNLGTPTVVESPADFYTITDDSGRTANLEIDGVITFSPTSSTYTFHGEVVELKYNGASSVLPENSLTYSWKSIAGATNLLEQDIYVANSFRITATYNSVTNRTDVVIQNSAGTTTDFVAGLAIVSLETNNGILEYEY